MAASLVGRAQALGHAGFSMCVGSVVVAHGPSALWHVESSQTRGQTHVLCAYKWTLNRWTSREVQPHYRFAIQYFCICSVLSLCCFFPPCFYQDILILSELTSDDFLKNGIYNSSGMMYWVFIFNGHLKNQNTAPAD